MTITPPIPLQLQTIGLAAARSDLENAVSAADAESKSTDRNGDGSLDVTTAVASKTAGEVTAAASADNGQNADSSTASDAAAAATSDVKVDDDDINLDGISLAYLHHFVDACGGRAVLDGLTTTDMCNKFIMPATEHAQTSACKVLSSFGRTDAVSRASWFVSHVWKYPFLEVLDALDSFFSDQDPTSVFVWFDLFTNSQHNTSARKIEWWKTTFMQAVKQIGNFVVILQPWNDPLPLTRAWCVFELYACHVTESNFHVAMPRAEQERFSNDIEDANAFYNMLAAINSSEATAWNPSDRDEIFRVIQDSVGFAKLDRLLFDVFGKWMQETLMDRVERASEDIEIARWKGILASLYEKQGVLDKAEPLQVDCLEKRKRILGEEHRDTLNSMSNLAGLYLSQGLFDKAEPLLLAGLKGERRLLGYDHPDTFISANDLATLYDGQGLYEKAEPLYLDCLQRSQRILGEDHSFTLTVMHNLAALYESQGLYDKAEPFYDDALKRKRRVLGENHPNTLAGMGNLADLYESQGLLDKAELLCVDCLERTRRVLGEDHPDTLIRVNNLALLYRKQGHYDKAEPLFLDCIERTRRTLGEDHPDLLSSLNNLAGVYRDQGLFDKAEPMFIDCLEKFRRVFGEDHPSSFYPLIGLARLYERQGLFAKAEPLFVECLERRRRVLGEDHPETVTTRENLDTLLAKMKSESTPAEVVVRLSIYVFILSFLPNYPAGCNFSATTQVD
ncbi:Kinesin light chain 3 [Phlyctochytrium bullatum]|nr:Kinesin light chain 3 [Phlyctochytrium bullatum]